MTTSVCMGIYNGEAYIEEQLQSILGQTKEPDEVILCDDGSRDHTVEIVEAFLEKHKLHDRWKLYRNETTKGYPGNFYYACSLCTMDVVFLADQDDIWQEQKIAHMCSVLERHPQARAVCCKFGLMNGEGEELHALMAPTHSRGTGTVQNITVADVFYKCEWPGMVVAYRNRWYLQWMEAVRPRHAAEGFPAIPHDLCICARAAEENGFVQLDEELAYHRRHDHNAGGEEHHLKVLLNKQRKLKEIQDYLKILNAFTKESVLQTRDGQQALQEKLCSMEDRYAALQSGKIRKVLKAAAKHPKLVRWATVVCDIVIVRQNHKM